MEASFVSSAIVTPAEIPIAKLPLSDVVASPSPTAELVTLCCEETDIFPCVVITELPAAMVALALLRASVTEASGTIEIDPAPAALDSVSVLEVWSALTLRLSGLSAPVNCAEEPKLAVVVFLCVATATDAPIPSVPPLTSGSDAASLLLSSIINANSSSAAWCASDEPSAVAFTSVSFIADIAASPVMPRLELSPIRAVVSFTSLIDRAIAPAIPTPPSSSPPPPTPEEANTPKRV